MTRVRRHVWTTLVAATALPFLTGNADEVAAAPLSHNHQDFKITTRSLPGIPVVNVSDRNGGGEAGGEGGEAGAGDPSSDEAVIFLASLDNIRASYIAARLALHDGRQDVTIALLKHAAADTYPELAPLLAKYGAPPLDIEMRKTIDLAEHQAPAAAVIKEIDGVLAAINAAAKKKPRTRLSESRIEAQLLLNFLNRAAMQTVIAPERRTELKSFWEGYGLFETAKARAGTAMPLLEWESPETAALARTALDELATAYRPTANTVATSTSRLLSDISRFELALSRVDN